MPHGRILFTSVRISLVALVTRMLCIVLLTADVPIICTHCLDTAWVVALCNKVHLVLGNLRQVHTALTNHPCNRFEPLTRPNRIRAVRYLDVGLVTQINTVARITCGCSATVRSQQHSTVFVRLFLSTLTQCTGYIFDTGLPYYLSHWIQTMLYLRSA